MCNLSTECSVFYSMVAFVLVPGLVGLLRTHAQHMLSSILLSFPLLSPLSLSHLATASALPISCVLCVRVCTIRRKCGFYSSAASNQGRLLYTTLRYFYLLLYRLSSSTSKNVYCALRHYAFYTIPNLIRKLCVQNCLMLYGLIAQSASDPYSGRCSARRGGGGGFANSTTSKRRRAK